MLMFTWVLMAVPKALVSLHLNLLMMLATPFNNSTATTGKDVPSRFVKIDSLVPEVLEALEAEVALVDVEALVEVLAVVVVASNPVVASEVASVAVAVVVMVQETLEEEVVVVLMMELEQFPLHLTLSPTMLLLAPKEARSSMFAM